MRGRSSAQAASGGVEAFSRDLFSRADGGYRVQERDPIRNEEVPVIPQQAWSTKRERQYQHIKESQRERGVGEDRAEEIAARTVDKERARKGEATTSSRLSRTDMSSGRRGGQRAHRKGPRGLTRDQLYEEARHRNITGRSTMSKEQLAHALGWD